MATLRDIRQRIGAVRNTAKITSAMKMVAAAKMRRAQDAITAARPYAGKLAEILANLSLAEMDSEHPLFQQRESTGSVLVIGIAADRGLCGSFNTNIIKATSYHCLRALPERHPGARIELVTVGRRAVQAFRKGGYNIAEEHPDVFGRLEFGMAQHLARFAVDGFTAHRYDRVELIFNTFKSAIRQEVTIQQLLPIVPASTPDASQQRGVDYIYEPSRGEILETLLPKYLDTQVWRALLDSNAAEQAARMMAMENATTNARDLIRNLQLVYNKERQAAITKEMLEIVSGAEALRAS